MTADQSFRFEGRRDADRTLGLAFAVSLGLHVGALLLYALLHVSPSGFSSGSLAGTDRGGIATVIDVLPIRLKKLLGGVTSTTSATGGGSIGGRMQERQAVARTSGVPVPSVDDSVNDGPLVSAIGFVPIGDPAGALEASVRTSDRPSTVSADRAPAASPVPSFREDEVFDGIEPQVDLSSLKRNVVYPEAARTNGIEGSVMVRVLVDEQGRATAARVEQSDNHLLEGAALDAIRRTRYTPGSRDGHAVPVWIMIPVTFRLR